jgi:hypothetical protein
MGLSVADLNDLTMGMVFDLAFFRSSDEREATQADFDNF